MTQAASPAARRALARLRRRPVNFHVDAEPSESGRGWAVDHYRQALPSEPPGPPTPGGPWEVATELIRDYEFADPRIVRAAWDPDAPLLHRDMLLEGRFFGLRFLIGVRVTDVVDEQREIDGRPVRVWGWGYRTLRGHLEAGEMRYEAWKWLDTGDVEFRMRRFVRTSPVGSPLARLGWRVFGRWMQIRFARRACRRMVRLVSQHRPPVTPASGTPATRSFPFRFEPAYRVAAAPFGVTPATARVQVGDRRLRARFGPWRLDTDIANVRAWRRTGPFSVWKTIGPAHLSVADHGLTFATNRARGLCVLFHRPVAGIDPLGRVRHPGLTVTVADVAGLAAALDAEREAGTGR
ncbi:MAG: DUF1990 domain-containing protein [Actinomycetota bacterium]|nr:DUF1990 domain-containing protein [Actinomycetota bacterium]